MTEFLKVGHTCFEDYDNITLFLKKYREVLKCIKWIIHGQKVCNEHESVIYEAFHVKITNIAEAQFPHLLHKTYTHIVYNMFPKTPRRVRNYRISLKFQRQSKSIIPSRFHCCS